MQRDHQTQQAQQTHQPFIMGKLKVHSIIDLFTAIALIHIHIRDTVGSKIPVQMCVTGADCDMYMYIFCYIYV